jgi:hypothetical protein
MRTLATMRMAPGSLSLSGEAEFFQSILTVISLQYGVSKLRRGAKKFRQ